MHSAGRLGLAYLVSLENLTIFATHVIYNRLHLNDVRFERFSVLRSLSFRFIPAIFRFACAGCFSFSFFLSLSLSHTLSVGCARVYKCVHGLYDGDFRNIDCKRLAVYLPSN